MPSSIAAAFGTIVTDYNPKIMKNEPSGSEAARIPAQGLNAHSYSLHLISSIFVNVLQSNKVLVHCNWPCHSAQSPCRNSVDQAAGKRPNKAGTHS